MDMKRFAGETYLKVDDVRAGPLRVQVAVVKEGRFDKPELVFESGEILALNNTNVRVLIKAYGRDDAGWIGKEIELHLAQIPFQGKPTDTIAVKPLSPSISPEEHAAAAAKFEKELDDEIPF